ncbi:MAG: MFS transporter [Holosporales bacterium]|jgi:MFS family permease|nr:MFS transporter [Holosporales bacterium]
MTIKNDRLERDGKIPSTVWKIAIMMFLMNTSYVMTYSFSGLYLKHILGASIIIIGVLEGFCEIVSHAMKPFSGMVSDFLGKRKGIMIVGYLFSVISKPILALSGTFSSVLSAKMMERLGNGIQAAPRDAIIGDVAPRKIIGASYGIKRSFAYIGSITGAALGIFAMKLTNNNYQSVFALATIPAVAAFFILVFLIKEPKRFAHPAITSETPMPAPKVRPKFSFKNFKYLGLSYWMLMAVNAVFMMAKMSETFLILRMNEEFQPDIMLAPAVMIAFNLGAAISSYPIGLLGDKLDRIKLLYIGIIAIVFSNIIMYSANSGTIMYIGILFWGIQLGATQNVFVSIISERVPETLRGTGHGCYWFINAISGFIADSLAGFVSNHFSLNYIFISSGMIGLVALLVLALLINVISPGSKRRKC